MNLKALIGVATAGILAGALCAGTANASPSPNLAINGGFETGSFSGWTLLGSGGGPAGAGSVLDDPGDAFGGNFFASFGPLTSSSTLSQSISTPGAAGSGTSGSGAGSSGAGSSGATGSGATGEKLEVSGAVSDPGDGVAAVGVDLNGASIGTINLTPGQKFTVFGFVGDSTAAVTDLSFDIAAPGTTVHLDSISVTAVPEPAAVVLFGTALLGLGLAGLKRRRRRQG